MTTLCQSADDRYLANLAYSVCSAPAGTPASGWHAVDQEIQALMSFAPAWERATALRSGSDDVRVVVFTASLLSLELEVMSDRVVGQVVPPGRVEIRVETSDGVTIQVEADEAGFFDLTCVPSGPVRLLCDTPNGQLVTDWVHL